MKIKRFFFPKMDKIIENREDILFHQVTEVQQGENISIISYFSSSWKFLTPVIYLRIRVIVINTIKCNYVPNDFWSSFTCDVFC